jgi:hypothetical protein
MHWREVPTGAKHKEYSLGRLPFGHCAWTYQRHPSAMGELNLAPRLWMHRSTQRTDDLLHDRDRPAEQTNPDHEDEDDYEKQDEGIIPPPIIPTPWPPPPIGRPSSPHAMSPLTEILRRMVACGQARAIWKQPAVSAGSMHTSTEKNWSQR